MTNQEPSRRAPIQSADGVPLKPVEVRFTTRK